MQAPPVPIRIGDHDRAIAYTMRAQYRMATLERPFAFSDLNKRSRSLGALVAWLWACLTPEHAAAYQTPEDLADAVEKSNVKDLLAALMRAVEQSVPSEKNGDGSMPGQPRSSSKSSPRRGTTST